MSIVSVKRTSKLRPWLVGLRSLTSQEVAVTAERAPVLRHTPARPIWPLSYASTMLFFRRRSWLPSCFSDVWTTAVYRPSISVVTSAEDCRRLVVAVVAAIVLRLRIIRRRPSLGRHVGIHSSEPRSLSGRSAGSHRSRRRPVRRRRWGSPSAATPLRVKGPDNSTSQKRRLRRGGTDADSGHGSGGLALPTATKAVCSWRPAGAHTTDGKAASRSSGMMARRQVRVEEPVCVCGRRRECRKRCMFGGISSGKQPGIR